MSRSFSSIAVGVILAVTGCAISQQQEVQMGQQYSTEIAKQLPIVNDAEVNRYINVLGDSIAKLTNRRDLDWHFYVVNSPEVNAFAVPGGFIYVNRGLIERSKTMSELAGVLGHEIGHVVGRHSVKQMQKMQGANFGIMLGCILMPQACSAPGAGDAINLAGGAVFAKFSRSDESEADRFGVQHVVSAGISPQGIVTMFQTLMSERRSRPAGVEAWFLTHPLEEDRIAEAQQMISQIPPETLTRLTLDSENFQKFKARVQSLPAARR